MNLRRTLNEGAPVSTDVFFRARTTPTQPVTTTTTAGCILCRVVYPCGWVVMVAMDCVPELAVTNRKTVSSTKMAKRLRR